MLTTGNPRKVLTCCWLITAGFQAAAGSLDTWTNETSGTTNNLYDIVYVAPGFITVGNGGTILTSSNGTDWVAQNSGTTNTLYGVAHANGLFVAVGLGPVRTSADGVTWTNHTVPFATLRSVIYENGVFVAVGAGGVIGTSTNGTNWTAQTSGTTTLLTDITFANGRFVAVGGVPSVILTSTNATNWTSVNPGSFTFGLWGAAFGHNQYVAVGGDAPPAEGGSLTTSPDGLAWTSHNTPYSLQNFYGITWGNGSFVAVGGTGFAPFGNSTNRIILSSNDGSTWDRRLVDTNSTLFRVAYGNGYFVAVGYNGAIAQSGPIFSLTGKNQFASGAFELDLTGEIGRGYRIQTVTNFGDTNWTDLTTLTNDVETKPFLDTSASNFSARYYRAVSP